MTVTTDTGHPADGPSSPEPGRAPASGPYGGTGNSGTGNGGAGTGSSGTGGPGADGTAEPDPDRLGEPGTLGIPLRPLSVGELLDQSWDLYRRWTRVSLLLGVLTALLAQVFALPVVALLGSLAVAAPNDEMWTVLSTILLLATGVVVTTFLTYVGFTVLSGLLSLAVEDTLFGYRVTLPRLRRRMRGRWLPLIGTGLLVGAMECAAALIVPAMAMIPVGWTLLQPLTAVAGPVTVLEGLNPFKAIGRTARLSGRDTGRVLLVRGGAGAIQNILTAVLSGIVASVVLIVLAVTGGGMSTALIGLIVATQVGTLITLVVIAPFVAYNSGLLYADRRMRAEGLDVELLLDRRCQHRRRTAVGRPA